MFHSKQSKKMKKVPLLFSMLAVVALLFAFKSSLPAFNWVQTQHDFGKVPQGTPITAEFSFTNKGATPLVVTNAKGSCGCTGVEYPKEPVMPGASAVIKATYNAAAVGPFNKSVTIESNAEEGVVSLNIQGEVIEK